MRNHKLLVVLGVLVLANLFVGFWQPGASRSDYDAHLFATLDTASVSELEIKSSEFNVALERVGSKWILNKTYDVDRTFIKILFNVLNRVQVKRPVSKSQNSEIAQRIGQSGQQVHIGDRHFGVGSNLQRTRTYFQMEGDEQVYEVEIPGYRDFIGGIFQLRPDQWRSRVVIDASWRTIQALKADYSTSDDKDFKIYFEDKFFKIPGVAALDSNKVVSYLNEFQNLQANERISAGRFARYDSLVVTPPQLTITLEDINLRKPYSLYIYSKLPGERIHLVKDSEEEMMVFTEKKIRKLMQQKHYFRYSGPL